MHKRRRKQRRSGAAVCCDLRAAAHVPMLRCVRGPLLQESSSGWTRSWRGWRNDRPRSRHRWVGGGCSGELLGCCISQLHLTALHCDPTTLPTPPLPPRSWSSCRVSCRRCSRRRRGRSRRWGRREGGAGAGPDACRPGPSPCTLLRHVNLTLLKGLQLDSLTSTAGGVVRRQVAPGGCKRIARNAMAGPCGTCISLAKFTRCVACSRCTLKPLQPSPRRKSSSSRCQAVRFARRNSSAQAGDWARS